MRAGGLPPTRVTSHQTSCTWPINTSEFFKIWLETMARMQDAPPCKLRDLLPYGLYCGFIYRLDMGLLFDLQGSPAISDWWFLAPKLSLFHLSWTHDLANRAIWRELENPVSALLRFRSICSNGGVGPRCFAMICSRSARFLWRGSKFLTFLGQILT